MIIANEYKRILSLCKLIKSDVSLFHGYLLVLFWIAVDE